MEGFVELGYYHTKTTRRPACRSRRAPATSSPTARGVANGADALGAAHPDNPYFGTAARLMYMPQFDIGRPGASTRRATSYRFVAGVKGTWNAWDFDTGISYSESKQTDSLDEVAQLAREERAAEPDRRQRRRRDRVQPGLRRAAAGHGVAHRRERRPQLRRRCTTRSSPTSERNGYSKLYSADFKVSREFGQLAGRPDRRRRRRRDPPRGQSSCRCYTGLGDYHGPVAHRLRRRAQHLRRRTRKWPLPVLKNLELNGALRYDHYTDAGNSLTPKIGAKWRAAEQLRAARHVRARRSGRRRRRRTARPRSLPSAAPSSTTTSVARAWPACRRRRSMRTASASRRPSSSAATRTSSPRSRRASRSGWCGTSRPRSSITADLWQIKRKGLPVIEDPQSAVDAGHVVARPGHRCCRRPTSARS